MDTLLQYGMQEIVDKWNELLLIILKAGFYPKKMQYGVEKMSPEESKDWLKLVTEEKRLELIYKKKKKIFGTQTKIATIYPESFHSFTIVIGYFPFRLQFIRFLQNYLNEIKISFLEFVN